MIRGRALSAILSVVCVAGLGTVASASLAIGDKLEPFTLTDAQGTPIDLASSKGGQVRVIMFVATRCPVSNAYNDRMATIATRYMERGVAVYGINSNREETPAEIVKHAREHGFPFPILKDEGNVQADRFGAEVTPEVYVFDAGWTLRYHGRIDDSRDPALVTRHDLEAALDAVLAAKPLPEPQTKAFGCTIKRVAQ